LYKRKIITSLEYNSTNKKKKKKITKKKERKQKVHTNLNELLQNMGVFQFQIECKNTHKFERTITKYGCISIPIIECKSDRLEYVLHIKASNKVQYKIYPSCP
jgi:hypothetical protein